jgi:cytochrome P450
MDELQLLDELRARHGPIFQRRPGVLYVAEPATAKAVLANTDAHYREHSDFFHTSKGIFGTRSTQQEIGRTARNLLRDHWTGQHPTIDLDPVTHWPDAGNLLLYRYFRDALTPPGEVRHLVDQVVRHAVLAGGGDRRPPVPRTVLRTQVRRALVAELSRRRAHIPDAPRDVLDILAAAEPDGTSHAALVRLSEVFLSVLFAITGSVGFLLGWSVYLLGTAPDRDADPAGVVREALRLWPVTWNFARSPARPHRLADLPVTLADEVVVCAYLVHRDERFWPAPTEFCPARWSGGLPAGGAEAFIPFGWGAHTCAAASFAVQLVTDFLRLLPPPARWHVEQHDERPHIAASLAPPSFTLRVHPG